MPNYLHGEYIYDGTHLMSADSNISQGHEEYIIQSICGEYAEDLIRDAKELNHPELKNSIDKIQKNINYGEYDPDEVYRLYDDIKDINPSLVSDPKLQEAMQALRGDSRKYGCKYLGYIIIRMNNFEVWELNKESAKKIVDAVHEIINEIDPERDIVDDKDLLEQEIVVHPYNTDISRTYTLEELQSGQLFKTASIPTTKANVFIPQRTYGNKRLSSTQKWQLAHTSEGFSFKEWLANNVFQTKI